jgi:ribose 5-phosphate isomerase A
MTVTIDKNAGKKAAAQAALQFIEDDMIVGVGTGSTVEHFIIALSTIKQRIEGAVSCNRE